jgi:hypothetical protein
MNSDTFMTTGTTHAICQDYALANDRRPMKQGGAIFGDPYAIVSDGCSRAADTDFGSRLVARAVRHNISMLQTWKYAEQSEKPGTDAFVGCVRNTAHGYCRALDLDTNALSATLLATRIDGDHYVSIIFGDGIIARVDVNGVLSFREYRYKSNAPYYLAYELIPGAKEDYISKFGLKMEVTETVITSEETTHTLRQEIDLDLDRPWACEVVPVSDYKYCGVMTDGASAFANVVRTGTSLSEEAVSSVEIVKEVMAFKGSHGKFVQRRMQRAMETFAKRGWKSTDDFSVAVVTRE